PAIQFVRAPKLPRLLPKPLAVADTAGLIAAASDSEGWLGVRDRALFMLPYGSGLRIEEPLSLNCDALSQKDALLITGKGNKQRRVPLLPEVYQALQDYLSACSYAPDKNRSLFLGARGARLTQTIAQRQMRSLRQQLNLPDT